MAQNKVQCLRGLSMPKFFDGFGSPEQCGSPGLSLALARGLCLPALQGWLAQRVPAPGSAVLSVQFLPLPMQPGQRHRLRIQQARAADSVPRHALDDAGQEQRLGAGALAPPGCVLSHRLAAQA